MISGSLTTTMICIIRMPTRYGLSLIHICLDHVQYLGDTTAKIAAEKAGILRPGVPVVYLDGDVDASAVICRKASELGAPQIPVSKKRCV